MINTKETGYGLATAKIILMGEHAVVHGEPALALPFPGAKIKTTITSSEKESSIHCYFFDGPIKEAPIRLISLTTVIEETLKTLNGLDHQIHIDINSQVPPERGMGSSAAVATSVVRALYDYFNTELTQKKLIALVGISEKIAHGNPSGLDAATTSGTTPLYFVKGQTFQPFEIHLTNTFLVVADTGIKGQTKEAVASIGQLLETDTEQTKNWIQKLGVLAEETKTAMSNDEPVRMGENMTKAHDYLARLGVSNHELDTLVETALENKALGSKLTGGGRGGCMISIVQGEDAAHDIAKALKEKGAVNTWIHQLGVNDHDK